MKDLIKSNWPAILDTMFEENDISKVAMDTFIKPLEIYSIDDESITFLSSNSRMAEFIEHKFYDMYLALAIEEITGHWYSIYFTYPMNSERTLEEDNPFNGINVFVSLKDQTFKY